MLLDSLKVNYYGLFNWFTKHILKGNANECHLITSSKTSVEIELSNIMVIREEKVKHLGIYMDKRLNFDYHIGQLYKSARKKLHALTRIFKYTNIAQRKLIANAFIMSQFTHCPWNISCGAHNKKHRMWNPE